MDVRVEPKNGWVPKNWCFQTVVLEKALDSPLNTKEIKPVNSKGNQPWIFIGRTNTKAEALVLWPSDEKSQHIGKDWCWERLRAGERDDRGWDGWMVSPTQWTWICQTLGDSVGQGSMACWCSWSCKESDRTVWLNNNKKVFPYFVLQLFIQ